MNSRPVRYAVKARIEPTDRSTLRVMITTAWPAASSSRIDGVSSRSRQELALKRKLGVLMVAAAMTISSTSRIDISRERTTVLNIRIERDWLLGSISRSTSALGASSVGRVLVSLMRRPPGGSGWRPS